MYCKAPKKVLSIRGMLHPGALSQKSLKKKLFLHAFRLFEYPHKIWFHATDEEEKMHIQNQFGEVARVLVAGNIPTDMICELAPPKMAGQLKMVTVSLISRMKNILAVLHALKGVQLRITYTLYGAVKDDEYWEECKKAIRDLPENISVHYEGDVPFDKVQECLASNHIFILPSESENFGHALYEALSAGRPVITSHNTPWKNLEVNKAGVNINPMNEIEIKRAIEFFAGMDAATLEEWSQCASTYAKGKLDKEKLLEEYREMFLKVEG